MEKDLDTKVTPDSLFDNEFYNRGFGKIPFIKFTKRKQSKKVTRRQLIVLKGKG